MTAARPGGFASDVVMVTDRGARVLSPQSADLEQVEPRGAHNSLGLSAWLSLRTHARVQVVALTEYRMNRTDPSQNTV